VSVVAGGEPLLESESEAGGGSDGVCCSEAVGGAAGKGSGVGGAGGSEGAILETVTGKPPTVNPLAAKSSISSSSRSARTSATITCIYCSFDGCIAHSFLPPILFTG
jgi:hypothetical protein